MDSGSNKDSGTGPNPVDNENIALNRLKLTRQMFFKEGFDTSNDTLEVTLQLLSYLESILTQVDECEDYQ